MPNSFQPAAFKYSEVVPLGICSVQLFLSTSSKAESDSEISTGVILFTYTSVSPLQLKNARLPMDKTFSGIVTEVILLQSLNAELSINNADWQRCLSGSQRA